MKLIFIVRKDSDEQFHNFTNLKLYLPLKMLQEWRMLLYPCCIYIKLTCNFKEMYHTTLCPTKIQWVYRWREKAYSTDKGYNVFYAHFPSTGTIQFPGVGQHVACKRKMNTRGVSIFQVFYYLLYESSTDIECLFLHTLYFIDGCVIQGRRKLSMNSFLMWIDSMLERTRHLIQHSITGSIFLKKDCHPSFALCNTLVISEK